MKKIFTTMIMVLAVAVAMAQAPEKFTYQAVVRNANNSLMANASVGIRVSILQGNATGNAIYVETQTATTNANGLLTLEIGGGNVQQGNFAGIDWANGPFFLKTETDPNGGSNYSVTSTQQMLSVPYALYAKDAGNGFSGDYNDLTNRPQIPQIPADVSAFNNDAGYITGYTETDPNVPAWAKEATKPAYDYSEIANTPVIPTVPTNVGAFINDVGYLTNFTEQQVLTISNDTLFLTGGSFVKLPATTTGFSGDYNDLINTPEIPTVPENVGAFTNDAGYLTNYAETDPQFNAWDKDYNDLINTPVIPTVPTNVGAFINDVGYLTSFTEQQMLTISNDTLFLTGGSFVKLPAAATGFSGDYNDLINTPEIPTVPTNVSAFTNDAGYISTAQCDGVDICNLSALVNSLMDEINSLRDSIAEIQNTMVKVRVPVVMVDSITNVSHIGAKVWVSVVNDGGDTVSALGFCWGTQASPTIDGQHLELTLVQGNKFSAEISNLQGETTYYVRAYATNKAGMAYSESGTFTTFPVPTLPIVGIESLSIGEIGLDVCGSVTDNGGVPILEHGFCWGYNENPTLNENAWQDINLNSLNFCHTIGDIEFGRVIHVRAYAVNVAGVAYSRDTVLLVTNPFDGHPCPNTPTMTDADGNIYPTVQLGRQCWIAQNLRTTQNNAENIPLYTNTNSNVGYGLTSAVKPYRFSPANDPSKVESLGYLYNWAAVIGKNGPANSDSSYCQGICPDGWHVPSKYEWTELLNYLGSQPQYCCNDNPNYLMNVLADSVYVSGNPCPSGTTQRNASGLSLRASGLYFSCYMYQSNLIAQWTSSFISYPCHTEGSGDRPFIRQYQTMPPYECMAVRCVKNPDGVNFGGSVFAQECSFSGDTLIVPMWGMTSGSAPVEYGACWSEELAPCISVTNSRTMPYDPLHSGLTYIKIPNVNPTGTIYVRAFIKLEAGTIYSDRVAITVPTVTTSTPTDITGSTASVGGTVTNSGGTGVTERGVCWSTSHNPTIDDAHTSDGSGTGSFTSSITGLEAGTTYYVRAYATNHSGTAYGDEVSFTATTLSFSYCPLTPTVTDYEGNIYNTVQIGDQCWMRENLRTTRYADGTIIALGTSFSATNPYYYDHTNSTIPLAIRGYHYNWSAVMHGSPSSNSNPSGVQGICPTGWHVPSDAEWTQLTDYVSSMPEYVCGSNVINIAKALAKDAEWSENQNTCSVGNDITANNATGFSTVPTGYWWLGFQHTWEAMFSSSTSNDDETIWTRAIYSEQSRVFRYDKDKDKGFPVRCLRD